MCIRTEAQGKIHELRIAPADRAEPIKPTVVYHADWGSNENKRWCARAALGADGCYTAFAPEPVGNPGLLIEQLRKEAGEIGCAFAGFDFPIGVPAFYAKHAGISREHFSRSWVAASGRISIPSATRPTRYPSIAPSTSVAGTAASAYSGINRRGSSGPDQKFREVTPYVARFRAPTIRGSFGSPVKSDELPPGGHHV